MMASSRLLVLGALAVGACSAPQAKIVTVCPTLRSYDATFEKQAAQQLAALPPDDPLVVMMSDYGALRQSIRACEVSR